VGSSAAGRGQMANRALLQGAGMPLEIDEFNRISGFSAGSDGMRAIVATFAVNAAVTL
jgi:hypothetical protein